MTRPKMIVHPVSIMSKLDNLNIKRHVAHFSLAIGNPEIEADIVSDIMSTLKREEKNLKVTAGDWKISAKCILKSKDGNEIPLPQNNPAVLLLKFGMQLSELASAMSLSDDNLVVIDSEVPRNCEAWLSTKRERKAVKPEVVPA